MSSTLEVIGIGSLTGSLLPPLTAIVQKPKWSANVKRIVAVIAAALGGIITVASTGGLNEFTQPITALGGIAAVIAASQTTYDLIWKPSKIAPTVEAATSSSPSTAG
ncbi:hypothetical protein HCJ76_44295 [Streptomyces sp. MC1]|uniref:hypothetical protein n=1 Tax=Streptomyces sp. MC1 TaxID=295105 RepID=UPI0018CA9454|nr:hypothetical protein [Streptomyces sp. MC1]MBG7704906.1 hypothetical protein [Streptomyces sp. MC1]